MNEELNPTPTDARAINTDPVSETNESVQDFQTTVADMPDADITRSVAVMRYSNVVQIKFTLSLNRFRMNTALEELRNFVWANSWTYTVEAMPNGKGDGLLFKKRRFTIFINRNSISSMAMESNIAAIKDWVKKYR